PTNIRNAILDGAQWWTQAFETAGFHNQFRVQQLPNNIDIYDPRINIILWTHCTGHGWSSGKTQTHPRTGGTLKGIVRLSSQRVEQLRALCQGVLSPYSTGRVNDMERLICARIRQLAAHEVGHALGLAHNFASHWHHVPSVMDYPAPMFTFMHDGVIKT